MIQLPKLIAAILFVANCSICAYSQEFLSDGSMKLSAISTDKKYGFEADHKTAIKVGTVENEYTFLNALTGPNGEKLKTLRVASCCNFECKTAIFGQGLLDKWQLTCEGLDKPIIIYLNGYEFEDPKCPYGLNFKKETSITPTKKFPEDSIVKAKSCG